MQFESYCNTIIIIKSIEVTQTLYDKVDEEVEYIIKVKIALKLVHWS